MSQVEFYAPVKNVRGKVEKGSGFIFRQKKYRAPNGAVLKEGVNESYKIVHPRDYQANPPKGAELAHHNRWREACQRAHAELNDPNRREYWQKRFYAQIPGGRGTKADPQAPIDRTTQAYKRYGRFDAFVRAMIYLDLKQSDQSDTQNAHN